jgi:hypothetical protein
MIPDLTTKQFGDACEHHVIASLGFAGIPAIKLPDGWPAADVIAQPYGAPPQRISVKGRRQTGKATHVDFSEEQAWEWLAVIVREQGRTQTWMLPRSIALRMSSPIPRGRRLYLSRLDREAGQWEENFAIGAPVSEVA